MTPFKFIKLGVIPYERTGDELRVGAAAAPVPQPPTYDDPTFFSTPILMQGLSSECGGFSIAFLVSYLLNTGKLSGSFAYAFEKTVDGVPDEAGTTIAAIGKAAQNEGVCLQDLFPDDGNVDTDPNGASALFTQATPQAIQDALTRNGWLPLFLTDLSWNGIQSAISKYKAVIIEAQVGEEWYTAPDGTVSWAAANVLPIRPPKTVIDSHFFVAGGNYTPTTISFANSWSGAWGNAGCGYFQENYIPFVKNAIILYKMPPSVTTVVNHPTLSPTEKTSLIQSILDDIEQAVGLVSEELGQL